MMADAVTPPQLQELLAKEQEEFCLKSYIADRRSKLKKQPALKRREVVRQGCSRNMNVCCFLPVQNSPDFYWSPLFEFTMAAKTGFRMFNSLLRSLSRRSGNKKERVPEDGAGDSLSRSSRLLSTAEWIEKNVVLEFTEEIACDFDVGSPNICISPLIFAFHDSPSFPAAAVSTPKFLFPAPDHVQIQPQEKEFCQPTNLLETTGEDAAEHSSPVSILETPFDDDYDNGNRSRDAEEGINDYDPDTSYQNLQRAKEKILSRISRFEKLAELDPIELEKKLAEEYSDNDDNMQIKEALPLQSKTFLPTNPKMHEESCAKISICGRVGNSNNVEFDTIEMMNGLDSQCKYEEEVEVITEEIVIALWLLLVQETWESEDKYCCLDG